MADATIVAVSTPPGRGGIGIVRLSGPKSVAIAQSISRVNKLKARQAQLCTFFIKEQPVDQGLLLFFESPHSYTGQDLVEFHAHGSPIVLRDIVDACIELGARAANPGEFSQIAFLNDKLDLAQAEAVADLINAGSSAAARAATRSLQGALSKLITDLTEQIIQLRVYCEAAIDFVDEDIDFLQKPEFTQSLKDCIDKLHASITAAESSRVLSEGLKVVILGPPNAGKSSLLNALSGRDSAIVTDIAGTTRDALKEIIDIDGMPLEITDTAGLHSSPDPVEKIGIERAIKSAQQADLVLALFDDSQMNLDTLSALLRSSLTGNPQELDKILFVANKVDLTEGTAGDRPDNAIGISVKTREGFNELTDQLKRAANYTEQEPDFLARTRHINAMRNSLVHLQKANELIQENEPFELAAEELRYSHKALEDIIGASSADDFLGEIFSRFCIGK